MLLVYSHAISLLEVPNEISLCLNISECPCKCKGCSEPYLQESRGTPLTIEFLNGLLDKYKNYNLTCISFMGGDSDHIYLLDILKYVKDKNIKTAFYSGFDFIDTSLLPYLDYYKYGRFILPSGDIKEWYKKSCGPINFPWSNQKMFKIVSINNYYKMIDITDEFRKDPISDLNRYVIKVEDYDEVSFKR